MRNRTKILTATAAVGLALAPAIPADATMFVINDTFEFHDEGSFDDCGFTIEFVYDVVGSTSIRTGKGDRDTAFFGRTQIDELETLTNPETGKFFTIEGHFQGQDVKAEHVEGSLFRFVYHEVGQPVVLRNMDGEVIVRDRGRLAFEDLFDTTGDDVPGGIFVEFLGVRVSGPHPAFLADDAAFCELASSLLL